MPWGPPKPLAEYSPGNREPVTSATELRAGMFRQKHSPTSHTKLGLWWQPGVLAGIWAGRRCFPKGPPHVEGAPPLGQRLLVPVRVGLTLW